MKQCLNFAAVAAVLIDNAAGTEPHSFKHHEKLIKIKIFSTHLLTKLQINKSQLVCQLLSARNKERRGERTNVKLPMTCRMLISLSRSLAELFFDLSQISICMQCSKGGEREERRHI
jgi:hypothetical protein